MESSEWRKFHSLSAMTGALAWRLPTLRPAADVGYLPLLGSFSGLLRDEPILRVRAWTAALVMASFTAYWAAIALRLSAAPFSLNAKEVAAFALIGAAGAAATPLAGRMGDRGWARPVLYASHLLIIVSLALCAWASLIESHAASLLVLSVGTILLDIGVTRDQTLGRRAVNLLRPEASGRMNGLFVGLFFVRGAVGAAAAAFAWTWGGWLPVCAVAASSGILALIADIATTTGAS
jgi:predicted MFS family arabinose efflux permease